MLSWSEMSPETKVKVVGGTILVVVVGVTTYHIFIGRYLRKLPKKFVNNILPLAGAGDFKKLSESLFEFVAQTHKIIPEEFLGELRSIYDLSRATSEGAEEGAAVIAFLENQLK
jgi:hypothetical protein